MASSSRSGDKRPRYKKKFGQHHLRSGQLCAPLLRFLKPDGFEVVEIGPGGGVLTAELLAQGGRVLALEVDVPWAAYLRAHLVPRHPELRLAVLDAQSFPWLEHARRATAPVLITGNLPFNVGTRLVRQTVLAAAADPQRFPRLGYMLQKEVADRLTASVASKAYGALTVLVRALADVWALGTLAPGAFRPPPKVSAAFVGLVPKAPDQVVDLFGPDRAGAERWQGFQALVHGAFGRRRKTLRNNLGATYGSDVARALEAHCELDFGRRAETLDLAELRGLYAELRKLPAAATDSESASGSGRGGR